MKCDDPVRAFIAIDISTDIREKIIRLQQRLSESSIRVGWVKPVNIHLTLAFLGDIQAKSRTVISDIMDDVVAIHKPFTCEVKGVGHFGRGKIPRILWVGLEGDLTELVNIQADVFTRVKSAGISLDDKPFVPHLTIARVRPQHHAPNIVALMEPYKDESFGNLDVKDLVLYWSELGPTGPSYTEMHRSFFRQ